MKSWKKSELFIYAMALTLKSFQRGGAGSCSGDSGAPLFRKSNDGETYIQIGIVHGNIGQCGNAEYPDIFAQLEHKDILCWLYAKAFEEHKPVSL